MVCSRMTLPRSSGVVGVARYLSFMCACVSFPLFFFVVVVVGGVGVCFHRRVCLLEPSYSYHIKG